MKLGKILFSMFLFAFLAMTLQKHKEELTNRKRDGHVI